MPADRGPLREVAAALRHLTAARDPEQFATRVVRVAREVSGAAACRLYLSDGVPSDGGTDTLRLTCSDPPRLPAGIWRHGRRRVVPLRQPSGQLLGELRLFWAAGQAAPPAASAVLSLLASQAALLLERLYEQEREHASLRTLGSGALGVSGLDSVLYELSHRVMRACGAECGGILLWDRDLDHLVVEVCVGEPAADTLPTSDACERCMLCWPSGGGLVTGAMAERRPITVGDVRLVRPRAVAGARSVIAAPMLLEGEPVGVISLGHSSPHAFTGAHLRLLTAIAAEAAWLVRAHQNRIAAEALALTEERSRIAQEIHDGVAQDLALLAMRAGLARESPEQSLTMLSDIREQLLKDIEELRRAVYALRPIDLEKMGLEAALKKLVTDFGEHQRLRTRLEVSAPLRNLEPRHEALVYRIVQEGLANAAKHGQASQVRVRVGWANAELLVVEVVDNGVGFNPASVGGPSERGGLGLVHTRERLAAIGGSLTVQSHPGEGTRLEAVLPAR